MSYAIIERLFSPWRTLVRLPSIPCNGAVVQLGALMDTKLRIFKTMTSDRDSMDGLLGHRGVCITDDICRGCCIEHTATRSSTAQFLCFEMTRRDLEFDARFVRSVCLSRAKDLLASLLTFPRLTAIKWHSSVMWGPGVEKGRRLFIDAAPAYHRFLATNLGAKLTDFVDVIDTDDIETIVQQLAESKHTFPGVKSIELPLVEIDQDAAKSVFPNAESFVRDDVLVCTLKSVEVGQIPNLSYLCANVQRESTPSRVPATRFSASEVRRILKLAAREHIFQFENRAEVYSELQRISSVMGLVFNDRDLIWGMERKPIVRLTRSALDGLKTFSLPMDVYVDIV